tara:strand:- start:2460 stop:2699 length:240 start_codon:yes stop_codon:yes gene_type:complete
MRDRTRGRKERELLQTTGVGVTDVLHFPSVGAAHHGRDDDARARPPRWDGPNAVTATALTVAASMAATACACLGSRSEQ